MNIGEKIEETGKETNTGGQGGGYLLPRCLHVWLAALPHEGEQKVRTR